MFRRPLMFNCDACGGDYAATRRNATINVYLADHRCNHVRTQCALCGQWETVFVMPALARDLIEGSTLRVSVVPHADADLRKRSARTWAEHTEHPSAGTRPKAEEPPPAPLTPRLEAEVARFREVLGVIPDDLLWDSMGSDE